MGVRLEWLLCGAGPMVSADTNKLPVVSTIASTGVDWDGYKRVPLFDVCANAGGGTLVDREAFEQPIAVKTDWLAQHLSAAVTDLAFLAVEGDSMEPTLRPRDLILLDRGEQRIREGIFVFAVGDELRVKRLRPRSTRVIEVISDNHAIYPIYSLKLPDYTQQIRIIGRVVGIIRRL